VSRWRVWLFDLDKTLVNVEDGVDYCAALQALHGQFPQIRARRDLPPVQFGRCAVEVLAVLDALFGNDIAWQRASDLVEAYEVVGARRSTPMPGLETLRGLRDRPPLGVVTLLGPRAARDVLRRHRLKADCVVAREAGVRMKPAPDPVLRALRQLGARAEEAVLVGDSTWDELCARAAGVAFVGISWDRSPPPFHPPTAVVRNLAGAVQFLLRP
jgi:phosphoglycolate phosphatase-like HAD superfamily hydrolase